MAISTIWLRILQIIFSLAIVAVAGVGLFYLFRSFDIQVITALIAAFVAFGVAITSNLVQKKREVEFKIRERKVEAYHKIFEFMMYFMKTTASSGELAETKVIEYLYDINYGLVLWGSEDVIIKWHQFQTFLQSQSKNADEKARLISALTMRNMLGELVKVIRSDLGHFDKRLPLDTLTDLYVPLRDKQEVLQKLLAEASATTPSQRTPS